MEREIFGINIDKLPPAPVKEVAEISRKIAPCGTVLLKNEKNTLPFLKDEKIAIFGRAQFEYLKSGTGSGGRVNTEYTVGLIDGLTNSSHVRIDGEISKIYKNFIAEHPFDNGVGWAQEPWSQEDMIPDEQTVKSASKRNDKALVVISRLCGEDRDSIAEEGGYLLRNEEKETIRLVCKHFEKVCVALNVGNIIDCSWIEEFSVPSVIFLWQGGQEGGNSAADVLCGFETPSGKLSDTIAKSIELFPSNENFGKKTENIYVEDIYVGYRYFETFKKDDVLFPFGFGLSYTKFDISFMPTLFENDTITVKATVKNVGDFKGAEVIQIYAEAPQGLLGKPARTLCGFTKTPVLLPNESCTVCVSFDLDALASYDDTGITGHKSAFVLESGEYKIHAGCDVRKTEEIYSFTLEKLILCEQCIEALSPVKSFKRIKPIQKNGVYSIGYESVPTRSYNLQERITERRPKALDYTGDKGIRLLDVVDGRADLDDFIAQIPPDELACIFMGEGMSSPKVKSGTGGAIGGVTEELWKYGVPIACVTDGPSGLRFDSGEKATSIAGGMLLSCTWDLELVEMLYAYLGAECYCYGVDALLGPGMNIHRHPLNGRNFEYFSEDPLLCGKIAAAITKGLKYANVSGTIKHFACNNQEFDRYFNDSVVSERALREIYLKCFEIAVKQGGADAIMTSYNRINGVHASSNYDLCTAILRDEWDYEGIVMTDWWPNYNDDQGESSKNNRKALVRSGNDLAMVMPCAKTHEDNILEALKNGEITLGEMQRNAKHILNYLINSNSFERFRKNGFSVGFGLVGKSAELEICDVIEAPHPNWEYVASFDNEKPILLVFSTVSHHNVQAQLPLNIYNGLPCVSATIVLTGTNSKEFNFECELKAGEAERKLKFEWNEQEITINKITIMQ